MSKRKPRLPATKTELKVIRALSFVTFLPGSGDKRFYKSIKDYTELTEGQRSFLYKIFEKYRRQIPHYKELALELQPERFKVSVKFDNTLFGVESEIEVQDLKSDKERWTKRDRINHSL